MISKSYEEFMQAAAKSAKFIREGGLKEEAGDSQIEEKAWRPLEEINAQGFITVNSQSGHSIRERAYVTGFMHIEKVEAFVKNLNLWSDKVAFFSLPIAEAGSHGGAFWSSIPVTKDYHPQTGWNGFTTLPLYQTKKMLIDEKSRTGLPKKFPALEVTVFDPKWGRTAWSKNGLFKDILEAMNPRPRERNELGDDLS